MGLSLVVFPAENASAERLAKFHSAVASADKCAPQAEIPLDEGKKDLPTKEKESKLEAHLPNRGCIWHVCRRLPKMVSRASKSNGRGTVLAKRSRPVACGLLLARLFRPFEKGLCA